MLDWIRTFTPRPLRWHLALPDRVHQLIIEHYGVGSGSLEDSGEEFAPVQNPQGADETVDEDAAVVRFVSDVISQAIADAATDIHFEPQEGQLRIRYRVDGLLVPVPLPENLLRFQDAIISRLKIMARLNISERRLPQDGRINFKTSGTALDIRVSTIPTIYAESVSLRLLNQKKEAFTMDRLGMNAEEQARSSRACSTTRTASSSSPVPPARASRPRSTPFSARSTRPTCASSPSRTRSNTRCPASTRCRCAPRSASPSPAPCATCCARTPTSSWSAKSATSTPPRSPSAPRSPATSFSPPSTPTTPPAPSRASSTWAWSPSSWPRPSSWSSPSAWCAACAPRAPGQSPSTGPSSATPWPSSASIPPRPTPINELMAPVGCDRCRGSGYRGRIGIFEILRPNDELHDLILKRESARVLTKCARDHGMLTLQHSGWEKVKAGYTTLEELLRVITVTEK